MRLYLATFLLMAAGNSYAARALMIPQAGSNVTKLPLSTPSSVTSLVVPNADTSSTSGSSVLVTSDVNALTLQENSSASAAPALVATSNANGLNLRASNAAGVLNVQTGGTSTRLQVSAAGVVTFNTYGRGIIESSTAGALDSNNIWTAAADTIAACAASPCTIGRNFGGAVSSITRTGTGVYVVNWTTSFWSSAPTCLVSSTTSDLLCGTTAAPTTTTCNVSCFNPFSSVATNSGFTVTAVGPRN